MMFGVLLSVIGSKVKAKGFSPFFAKNHKLIPWDLGENFNFSKIFSIGNRSREMIFAVLFSLIGSKVEAKWVFRRFSPKTMN